MNELGRNVSLSLVFILGVIIVLTYQHSYAITYKYTIKVTFDSITVHNDREGTFSGDGEFDLSAYVQGKRVALSGSTTQECLHAGSEFPPCDLWDVSPGETLIFKPGTEATVVLPQTIPLSIFTIGNEVDRLWPSELAWGRRPNYSTVGCYIK